MSRIDEMIARLCPDGVEYKTLGEVGVFTRGSGIQKKDFVDEGEPCIHYGQIYTRFGMATDKVLSLISEEQYRRAKKAQPGDIIIAITSENVKDVCTPLVWEGISSVAISGHSCAYHTKLNSRYIAYYMGTEDFFKQKKKIARGTKVIEVKPSDLAYVKVPIPPMEIQEEIVRILDSFAKLEAELEAELEARKAQYAYYRDQLLDFTDRECSWLKLGEIGTFMRGRRFTKSDYRELGIPSIHYADIYTKLDTWTDTAVAYLNEDKHDVLRYAQPGDVVIACTGEDSDDIAKAVAWLGDRPVAVHDDCAIFHHQQNPKYISYLFQTHRFAKFKKRYATEAKMTRLSAERIAQFEVPVPSLAEQQRIVDILDRFDAITMSLTDGLPAEIEARRRQYGYYRDRLLDFPKKE
ncbi:restriction endonuclease [Bifidobacterium callitrichos]|nr:restriction endonuclease [Bifidobacterium callitrichos]